MILQRKVINSGKNKIHGSIREGGESKTWDVGYGPEMLSDGILSFGVVLLS